MRKCSALRCSSAGRGIRHTCCLPSRNPGRNMCRIFLPGRKWHPSLTVSINLSRPMSPRTGTSCIHCCSGCCMAAGCAFPKHCRCVCRMLTQPAASFISCMARMTGSASCLCPTRSPAGASGTSGMSTRIPRKICLSSIQKRKSATQSLP